MSEYRLAAAGVVRVIDGAVIPADAGNRDWREYLSWAEAGGVAEPYAPPPRAPWIAKTAIYRRCTDAELATLDAAIAGASLRDRRMWADAAEGLVAVADVQPMAEALFGAERAAELLAP